jgi:hypothetical protein
MLEPAVGIAVAPQAVGSLRPMAETEQSGVRYRCAGCGNLTRFDVTVVRRTKEFRHFTVGGDLEIESVEVLEEDVQSIACRWCGATDDRIEVLTA